MVQGPRREHPRPVPAGRWGVLKEGLNTGEGPPRHELTALLKANSEVAGSISNMVRPLSDTSIRIPRSEWTVGEAAAHVAATQAVVFKEGLEGAASPYGEGRLERFASVNRHQLAHFPERDGPILADLIDQRTAQFLELAAGYPENFIVDYHFGPMDLTVWLSYCLTHLLMHACPIAYALKQKPPITAQHVQLTIPFFEAVAPRVFDKAKAGRTRATVEFRFARSSRMWVTIDRGKVAVEKRRPRRVSLHVSGNPVAMFLVLIGIRSQWPMILQGKVIAWGPRPWLALRVKEMFPNP